MFSNGFRLVCIICPIFIVGTTKSTTCRVGHIDDWQIIFCSILLIQLHWAYIYTSIQKPSTMQQYQSIATMIP
jgi:hypothetical protein